jgi:glycosyltransferase involved in cell wall biosynthesis
MTDPGSATMPDPPPVVDTVIVVPCYDEAARLDVGALVDLAGAAGARIIAVDDGSTDATGVLLAAAARAHPEELAVLTLPANGGKGEAVRAGMRAGLEGGAAIVAYYDADLATPPAEMARLVAELRAHADRSVVLGSRVGLLGHRIDRSLWRHYLGRVFATVSSAVLGLAVYDTQCGAKVFRDGPALRAALAEPFSSRWAFDVELLGRLLAAGADAGSFVEVPLREWRDVAGSKLGPSAALAAALDLATVARTARRRRRQPAGSTGASNKPTV